MFLTILSPIVKYIEIYINIIKLKSLLDSLNALISGSASPIRKILLLQDSSVIEKGT